MNVYISAGNQDKNNKDFFVVYFFVAYIQLVAFYTLDGIKLSTANLFITASIPLPEYFT